MSSFLSASKKQLKYYQALGIAAINQCPEHLLFWQYNNESNSIAIIVNHISGNMLSRWTDFLESDGEKTWRNRDQEFQDILNTKEEILNSWNEGWNCLFNSLNKLSRSQLEDLVYIRNQGHTVSEAILRQLAHYSYHIGQMVYISRMAAGNDWKSLSIPKGGSKTYNEILFKKEKSRTHFTDNLKTDLSNHNKK